MGPYRRGAPVVGKSKSKKMPQTGEKVLSVFADDVSTSVPLGQVEDPLARVLLPNAQPNG